VLHATLARFASRGAAGGGESGAAAASSSSAGDGGGSSGGAYAPPRTTVYARTAASLDAGSDLRLVRAAMWPPEPPGRGAAAPPPPWQDSEEVIILQAGGGGLWEGDGGGGGGPCDVEASLVREEVVVLPHSASLVFPLSEGEALVGLLVAAPTSGSGANGDALPFSDDELWCLRQTAGPLARACAMDLRNALAGAAAAARQRLARSLLREVQGPLKALRTFSAMLAPRLGEGEPEGDMAAALLTQQRRMNEVVAQLEAALHAGSGGGAAARALPPGGGAAARGLLEGGGGWGRGQAVMLEAPGGAGRPTLLASASSLDSATTVGGSSAGSSGAAGEPTATADVAPGSPRGGDCGDCRSAAQAALSQSLGAAAPSGSAATAGAAAVVSMVAMPAPGPAGAGPQRGFSMPAIDASASTIDVEPEPSRALAAPPVPIGPPRRPQPARRAEAAARGGAICNVVEALSELLPAAASLARASGVDLIALPPLRTTHQHHHQPQHQQRREQRQQDATAQQRHGGGDGTTPALLPRPARPLLASAPGATVRRALSCLLDLAVQCTPRGGRVTVGAREAPGGGGLRGVEVAVTLTGHLAPGRRHAGSRGLGGAAAGAGAPPVGASPLVSLELAERLVTGAGGRLRVMHPRDAPGGGEGAGVVSTTRVELLWPGAPAGA
jgi:hypothetical protein